MSRKWTLALILVMMVVMWLIGFVGGALLTHPTNLVCHAITEDSDISDCSYHDGAWWTK